MLPIVLNSECIRVGLAGQGELAGRRRLMLEGAGVRPRLLEGRVSTYDLGALDLLFVAGVEGSEARTWAAAAREAGVLVNVEDMPDLCDFHVPAVVRQGDLLLTVSTGGRAPGLASAVRSRLTDMFGPEWRPRLDELATLRGQLRASGLAAKDVAARMHSYLAAKGWLA